MAMPTISQVRDAIASTITNSVTTLIGYDTIPDVVQLPAVVVQVESGKYLISGGNSQIWEYSVAVLVPRTESRVNQDQLDAYLSVTGASSIPAALQADSTLGGLDVTDATVTRVTDYGAAWEAAAVPHIGARLHVTVVIT